MTVIAPPVRLQGFDSPAATDSSAVFYPIDDCCGRSIAPFVVVAGHQYVSGDQESAHARMSVAFADNGSLLNAGFSGYRTPTSVHFRSRNGVTPTADLHCSNFIGGTNAIYAPGTTTFDLNWSYGQNGNIHDGFSARPTTVAAQFSGFVCGFTHDGVAETNHQYVNNVFAPAPGSPQTYFTGGPIDLWIAICANETFDTDVVGHSISIGLATSDGTQYCLAQSESNGVAAGRPAQVVRNNAVCAQQSPTAATVNYSTVISTSLTDYTLTSTGADPVVDVMGLYGLQLPAGVSCKLFSFTTPTVTGQVTYTDPGFKPQFVLFVGSSMEAFNTPLQNDAKAGGFQISAIQYYGTDVKQYAVGSRIKQGANPTNTASAFSEHALAIPSDSSCYAVVADFVSFSNTGFTLDYTTVAAAGKVVFALAIEYVTPECGVPPTEFSVGGTNFMLDVISFDEQVSEFAKKHFLETTDTGSEIHVGPFRYAEQKAADETSSIDGMIVGVAESRNGEPVQTDDWLLSDEHNFHEDFNGDGSDDEEEEFEDWGHIPGFPDLFNTELMNTDDGRAPQYQGVDPLTTVEEFDAARKYETQGFSSIMHRVRFYTSEVGHKFYIKMIDIAGLLTGRHR